MQKTKYLRINNLEEFNLIKYFDLKWNKKDVLLLSKSNFCVGIISKELFKKFIK